MPARRYILTALVVACMLGAGFAVSTRMPDPLAARVAFAAAGLFALAVIRSSLIKPYLVTRRWREYGARHGHETVIGRHGEPRMVGDRDGLRFIVAQSTSLLGGTGGYYARTVVTAAIEHGVPDGLRVYRRDALEWMHHLSGLREVKTGDEAIDRALMIEGADSEVTAAWVAARIEALSALSDRYPRFIVYGSEIDGLPVASGGASGAVTLIVVGRRSKVEELDEFIEAACSFAQLLGEHDSPS